MSSDVHRTISVFLSLLDCLLGQYEGIINLCVDSGADHRCVDAAIKHGLAIKLGASVGDDDLVGLDVPVHNALIAADCVTSP